MIHPQYVGQRERKRLPFLVLHLQINGRIIDSLVFVAHNLVEDRKGYCGAILLIFVHGHKDIIDWP
jgi:hypothetical protein